MTDRNDIHVPEIISRLDELLPISSIERANRMIPTVNARDLHRALGVGKDFSNWIKGRVDEYGFIEGQDFVKISNKFTTPKMAKLESLDKKGWARDRIDYHLTFGMAKELGMVEKTPAGRAIRLYFIRKEEQARSRFMDEHVQAKLAMYLTEEMRPWQKTFPDELWMELARLTGKNIDGSMRPQYWGKFVNEFIYGLLDQDVKDWLKENAPKSVPGKRYHQHFNEQFGLHRLREHIWLVIGTARNSFSIKDLRRRLRLQFNKTAQLSFIIPIPAQEAR